MLIINDKESKKPAPIRDLFEQIAKENNIKTKRISTGLLIDDLVKTEDSTSDMRRFMDILSEDKRIQGILVSFAYRVDGYVLVFASEEMPKKLKRAITPKR